MLGLMKPKDLQFKHLYGEQEACWMKICLERQTFDI